LEAVLYIPEQAQKALRRLCAAIMGILGDTTGGQAGARRIIDNKTEDAALQHHQNSNCNVLRRRGITKTAMKHSLRTDEKMQNKI
jgi:hypothetical protein